MKRTAYHHGDLAASLLAEGLRALDAQSAETISLRALARAVGVSATSVYRHFPDREALLSALAREGARRLSRAQREAFERAGGGRPGFAATGRAYVRFALANPSLFRLIFTAALTEQDNGFAQRRTDAVLDITAEFAGPRDRVEAIRDWALIHGLVMLMLDGQVPVDDALIERIIGGPA
ncbi:WHG domain-containing protein [Ameyamaea chiangmaiensis]|nr:TetR/AcrR family transcriptional regulator [Ameyamaea chiangmaiensis]MBS4075163.1 WHG domain-containing protein [Ameyamaea chiangmaiensis]